MGVAPKFFPSPSEFRRWLEKYHSSEQELWVGFYKRSSAKPSITWPEAVDQALCFGWIDGVRRSLGDESYVIRFTPRKKQSKWSSVNTKRVKELTELGLMQPAGLASFAQRTEERSGVYSYEQRHLIVLDERQQELFRANKKAWGFFEAQPNWYRKAALWWVVSAKREDTRLKRLEQLIARSEQDKPIAQLDRTKKSV